MDQAEGLRRLVKEKAKGDKGKKAASKKSKIISITSGKGGVGKTNFAINLAIAFVKLGKSVIVMDADLGLANVNVILGIIPKYNLFHVLKGEKKMKDIMFSTPYGIKVIAGASGFAQLANLEEEKRQEFIKELETLSFADIIIVDTAAGISNNVLNFVLASDEAIIITTPEPTSITDAYGIIKSIVSENQHMDMKLVVNRVHSTGEGKNVADRIINIAGQFLNVKIENLGYVFEDNIVSESVTKQKPFIVLNPKSKAAASIFYVARRLENIEDVKEDGGLAGFIRRLFGRGK